MASKHRPSQSIGIASLPFYGPASFIAAPAADKIPRSPPSACPGAITAAHSSQVCQVGEDIAFNAALAADPRRRAAHPFGDPAHPAPMSDRAALVRVGAFPRTSWGY